MSIQHFRTKIKNTRVGEKERAAETLVFSVIVALVGVGSFGVGMLAERARLLSENSLATQGGVIVTSDVTMFDQINQSQAGAVSIVPQGNYFASRSGTAFYPLGCTAGDRILPENKIYFGSIDEAEMAGYKKSASCDF